MHITYLSFQFYIIRLVIGYLNIDTYTSYHLITKPVIYHMSPLKVSVMKSLKILLLNHILIL